MSEVISIVTDPVDARHFGELLELGEGIGQPHALLLAVGEDEARHLVEARLEAERPCSEVGEEAGPGAASRHRPTGAAARCAGRRRRATVVRAA